MKRALLLLNSELDDEANINLTPLIDVVFVVLIMFILVAPLVEVDRIQLAHSTSEKNFDLVSSHGNSEIKIHVYKDNSVWLNGTPLSFEELKVALTQFHHLTPNASPQIFHDREAFFGTYQSVKNIAESIGFQSLDIILQPG